MDFDSVSHGKVLYNAKFMCVTLCFSFVLVSNLCKITVLHRFLSGASRFVIQRF